MGGIIEKIKIILKNRTGKPLNKEENVPYDKVEDDDAPIEPKKDDKKPGKVKLNGGEHDTVFGLNRKVAAIIMASVFVLISVMYIYNIQDSKARETIRQEEAKKNTQDSAAKITSQSAKIGYDDVFHGEQQGGLAGANSRFANRGNPQNGADPLKVDPKKSTTTQNAGQSQEISTPVTSPTPVVATPTLPQIPSYNNYASTTPTATQQQTPAVSEAERAENERQKQIAERYKSSISFSLGSGGGGLVQSSNNSAGATASQGNNGATLASTAQSPFPSTPIQYMAASDGVLQAGTLIPAILFSGINTNVAGQVTAQTVSDVYDTATRSNLLIPAGSQLIGSYAAGGSDGNNRVNVTFSTLVLPDGSSYAIDNSMVAVDGAGYNGIAGKIDHHTDKALRDGLLNSMFTAISSKWANRVYLDMSNIANISKMEGIQPTITINPGKEFNLFVTKPIIFAQ